MGRKSQNWIGLGFSLLYLICFLFLPFLQVSVPLVFTVGINGLKLLQFGYGIMYIPLVLAIAMAFSSVAMNERISIIVGAVSFLITLVMALACRPILLGGTEYAALITALAGNSEIGEKVITMIQVSVGVGGLLCTILAAAHVVAEFLMNRPEPNPQPEPNPFGDNNIF